MLPLKYLSNIGMSYQVPNGTNIGNCNGMKYQVPDVTNEVTMVSSTQ